MASPSGPEKKKRKLGIRLPPEHVDVQDVERCVSQGHTILEGIEQKTVLVASDHTISRLRKLIDALHYALMAKNIAQAGTPDDVEASAQILVMIERLKTARADALSFRSSRSSSRVPLQLTFEIGPAHTVVGGTRRGRCEVYKCPCSTYNTPGSSGGDGGGGCFDFPAISFESMEHAQQLGGYATFSPNFDPTLTTPRQSTVCSCAHSAESHQDLGFVPAKNRTLDWQIKEHELDVHWDDVLGSGAFSTVYKGTFENRPVAIKVFEMGSRAKELVALQKEVEILRQYRHSRVVHMYGACCMEQGYFTMVLELFNLGCLSTHIGTVDLTVRRMVSCGTDVAMGLAFIHSLIPQLAHRDLKPDNLGVSSYCSDGHDMWRCKLMDWGIAKNMQQLTDEAEHVPINTPGAGTLCYMAPECASGIYDMAIDVWSYGLVLWCMAAGDLNPCGKFNETELLTVLSLDLPGLAGVREDVPDSFVQLIKACLRQKGADRPPFTDIVPLCRAVLR